MGSTYCEWVLHKLEQLSRWHREAGDSTHGKLLQTGLHLLHLVGLDGAEEPKELPVAGQWRALHAVHPHQLNKDEEMLSFYIEGVTSLE